MTLDLPMASWIWHQKHRQQQQQQHKLDFFKIKKIVQRTLSIERKSNYRMGQNTCKSCIRDWY